ncbi:MAG: NAD(P)H-dependent flavin oxidoreductase [Chloroflexota bacterium]
MRRTGICDLLGIRYPILQGGLEWIAGAEIAAAVSNAGALGTISPTAGMADGDDLVENLRSQIREARRLTDKPFAVNLPIQTTALRDVIDAAIDVVVQEGVTVVTTSAGNPFLTTGRLKKGGLKVLHVVASVKHAEGAEKSGVDAVVAEGCESGGHTGFDEMPTFALVPQVVDAVRVPVVAAGGIADARGLVAALALGAEGVQIGTRFVATEECPAHSHFKQEIIKAIDTATVVTMRGINPIRELKNRFTARFLEIEKGGASPDALSAFVGDVRLRAGVADGQVDEGELPCGVIAGMVRDIVRAGDVVRSIVDGYDRVVDRL